jgi:hypothetical protein
MKRKLLKEVLHIQVLSVELSERSAHLNTYHYNNDNITFTVVHFHFYSCLHPEDL